MVESVREQLNRFGVKSPRKFKKDGGIEWDWTTRMFPGTCRVPLGTQVLFKSGHAVQGASSAVSQNFKSDDRREPTPFVVMRKV